MLAGRAGGYAHIVQISRKSYRLNKRKNTWSAMRWPGGVAVTSICLPLHGLAQMTGKEANDYVVRLPRLGRTRSPA